MRITAIGDEQNRYEVESDSGSRYEIRYAGTGDDAEVDLWTCSCPAGRHGRTCKHLRAFWEWLADERERIEAEEDAARERAEER